jgi:hypothetical protein
VTRQVHGRLSGGIARADKATSSRAHSFASSDDKIRDLELEVGIPLLERGARGIALTAAGRTFWITRVCGASTKARPRALD